MERSIITLLVGLGLRDFSVDCKLVYCYTSAIVEPTGETNSIGFGKLWDFYVS